MARGGQNPVAPGFVAADEAAEALQLRLELLDGLEEPPPVLDGLRTRATSRGSGSSTKERTKALEFEDRLERDGVREGAQEMARIGHRGPLAQGGENLGGEALARGAELLEALGAGAQVRGDLGPGGREVAVRRGAGVIRDLEAVPRRDEARQHLLLRFVGPRGERQAEGDDAPRHRVLEDEADHRLAGFPRRTPPSAGSLIQPRQ